MPPRTTYIGGDSDDDDEEETVDLRVSASRQDEDLNKSGKRPVFKRIPSSTSTVKSFRQSGNSGTGHHIIDLNETERRPAAPLYEFTKRALVSNIVLYHIDTIEFCRGVHCDNPECLCQWSR